MLQNLYIRASIIEDADDIGRLNALCWQESYKGIVSDKVLANIDWQKKSHGQKKIYALDRQKSFVAIVDDKIVGYCNIGTLRSIHEMPSMSDSTFYGNENEWGEVQALYVSKSYSRLGIGKELMNKAREELLKMGYKQFQIYVLENNIPALTFYKNQGGLETITRNWNEMEETYKMIGLVFYI